jgi:hypothetical protein
VRVCFASDGKQLKIEETISALLVEMEVMALEPPLSPTFFFFYLYLLK